MESGARAVVGVNRFQMEDGGTIPAFRLDPALEQAQLERLRQVRASRNQQVVDQKLAALSEAARTDRNLMPLILDAAEAYATVGEISDAFKSVFGEYRER